VTWSIIEVDRIERPCYFVKTTRLTALHPGVKNSMTMLETATKGQRTRQAILDVAAGLATEEGLEPLSIGRLAEAAGMSKSGLFAHFGSKEELQLATVDHAASIFVREVIAPAREAPEGLARVWALCEGMIDYSERQVFPGGCFFASASFEFKRKPGPVRERVEASVRNWRSYLQHAVERARETGDLDDAVGVREIAFELDAYAQAANAQYQLFRDDAVFDDARRAVRQRLESLRPPR
jgi:AcrR family transcriptional regulator